MKETSIGEFIRNLPSGSEVNIAAESNTEDLVIPWGFVYDSVPPEDEYSGVVNKEAFWGHRFQLTIRPSSEGMANPAMPPTQLVVGHVYELPEAGPLSDEVSDLFSRKGILKTNEIVIKDSWLPELETVPYDLLHFLCHGYTELSDVLLSNALAGVVDDGSLKYISVPAKGSQLFTKLATATLAALQFRLKRLQGAPVVLLSMCHSAQVSSSGGSFVTFFLRRGARAVVGTEGPNPFALAFRMDKGIIGQLLEQVPLRRAVWEMRKAEIDKNPLALIYTVYGDGQATLAPPP